MSPRTVMPRTWQTYGRLGKSRAGRVSLRRFARRRPWGALGCRVSAGGAESVAADHVAVPGRAVLRGALLRVVVDVDQAEPLVVSVAPLEVVQERPGEVAAQVDTGGQGGVGSPQVSVEVRDPFDVAYPALDRCVHIGRTILGHHDGSVRMVGRDPDQQVL